METGRGAPLLIMHYLEENKKVLHNRKRKVKLIYRKQPHLLVMYITFQSSLDNNNNLLVPNKLG
jgi:hypothetical protein